ncbi:G-protein-signaling modulator 1 [Lates japonicus]|uniref:G-protein-signaling modulator 1 n=1 Tax=Lates japonicus TaxID=270547 RepID=A0AAD3RKH6_LATJO|nr:G-protein-signaling modulator 1 [Lates japonicus]
MGGLGNSAQSSSSSSPEWQSGPRTGLPQSHAFQRCSPAPFCSQWRDLGLHLTLRTSRTLRTLGVLWLLCQVLVLKAAVAPPGPVVKSWLCSEFRTKLHPADKRLDDQRASLGLLPDPGPGAALCGPLQLTTCSLDFYYMLSLPGWRTKCSFLISLMVGSVPEGQEDFFSLIQRVQSGGYRRAEPHC